MSDALLEPTLPFESKPAAVVEPQLKPSDPLTVSALSAALKGTLESTYGKVRVQGEISGLKIHSSGHIYFALKDTHAVLDAVCWRGTGSRLACKPSDGLEVVASGKITAYPGRSKYQLVVENLELTGEGNLLKLLEERKRRLLAEGLFDGARKQALPPFPKSIGLITSPTGAVIQDILHRLGDRFPLQVYLWPVAVQGDQAVPQICEALQGFKHLYETGQLRPDVIIVARGGGSLEDLWAFNEEAVVRSAAACPIPLISAIGHETDTTLIDFAADQRAPTPTAAAEMAVPERRLLVQRLQALEGRLQGGAGRHLDTARLKWGFIQEKFPKLEELLGVSQQRLDDACEALALAMDKRLMTFQHTWERFRQALRKPDARLERCGLQLAQQVQRLQQAFRFAFHEKQQHFQSLAKWLDNVSYPKTLERGFCFVTRNNGVTPRANALTPGDDVTIHFSDGEVAAKTLSVKISK